MRPKKDEPKWQTFLYFFASRVMVPPVLYLAKRTTTNYPEAGDVFARALVISGSIPVADVLKDIHFKSLEDVLNKLKPEPLSPRWVDDLLWAARVKGVDMWLLLIHHSVEGLITPREGPLRQANQDLMDIDKRINIDLSLIEGIDATNVDSVARWVAHETLKSMFTTSNETSYYFSSGRGRRAKTNKDLIQEWLDRGFVEGDGQVTAIALHKYELVEK
ncbi:MAG: hypothetical protein KME47_09355 [Nodosilinea sp. WJT8-NPBG4]|jgi:hypothetical protein|nr:hypothetical protein [Nodosilinea sp. WJT8-NPBG4]